MRALSDLEGFDIQVFIHNSETPADPKKNGLAAYPFEKKAKGSTTVADWKANRFQKTYPGYWCEVLDADGNIAHGNTKLESVRETYEE